MGFPYRIAMVLLLVGLSATVIAADRYSLDLVLADAVWWGGKDGESGGVGLRLCGEGGMLEATAWGEANERHDQYGRVLTQRVSDRAISAEVLMLLQSRYNSGNSTTRFEEPGRAVRYALALRRSGDTVTGEWQGDSNGEKRRGSVQGTVTPIVITSGFTAPAVSEHPRFLLRRDDLKALRAKAQSPWARPLLSRLEAEHPSRSNMAVGRGLLYQLTGDRKHAEAAQALLLADIDQTREWWPVGPVHDPGHTALEACIAYDLIHDACDAAFHGRMQSLFAERVSALYWCANVIRFNGGDGSNWVAMYRSGSGMVALSMAADSVPYPPAPVAPELPRLQPPAGFAPGTGVPVVPLEAGKEWHDWLFAGPFEVPRGTDVLAGLGGEAAARPAAGSAVKTKVDGREVSGAFGPATKAIVSGKTEGVPRWASGGMHLDKSGFGRSGFGTGYFYSVIDNPKAGFYRVDLVSYQLDQPCIYIDGQRYERGAIVHLAPGRYPVLARVPRLPTVPTNHHDRNVVVFRLRLQAVEDVAAQSWLAAAQAWHAGLMVDWEAGRAEHERSGGIHPRARFWVEASRRRVERFPLDAFGRGGFTMEGEAYTQHSYRQLLPFLHSHQAANGYTIAADSLALLRTALGSYAMRTVFHADGASMHGFANGGGTLGVDNLPRGFALLEDAMQPAMLWTWNRTQALADAGKLRGPWLEEDVLDPLSAAFRFVNYPLEMKEAQPGTVFKNVAVDEDFGATVFRDRWQDADDFVCTVFEQRRWTRERYPGVLRVTGLGEDWVVRGSSGGDHRNANRVFIPGKGAKEMHGAITQTFFAAAEDGSGIVGMDMSKLYGGTKVLRGVAIDYSRASGAPGLVAVVDRVEGAGGKGVWQLVTDGSNRVTVAGGGFSIAGANGATLQATVVSPAKARIGQSQVPLKHEANYHDIHRGATFQRTVVTVEGGDDFFIVMTVQRGAAPPVTVEGSGLGATASVGKQTIRFDGQHLVLGTFTARR